MRKITLLGMALLLIIPVGIVSAQDPCMDVGGMIDPETGKCVQRAALDVQINYPVELVGTPAQFAVDLYLAELQDDFIDNFIEFTPEPFSSGPWSLYVDYEIYNRPGFSRDVVFIVSEYTGGAHPFGFFKIFVFSESDGTEIRLASLFEPGSNPYATLAQVIPARLNEQSPDLYDPAFFAFTEDPLLYQKFVLTSDAIIFFFDQYEIAPGAAGNIKVRVPLTDLAGILIPALR